MGPVTSKMLARQARLLARLGAKVEGNAASAGVFGTPSQKIGIATEATFDYHPYKLHHLDEGPATSTTLTRGRSASVSPDGHRQEDGDSRRQSVQGEGYQGLLSSLLWPGGNLLWHWSWDKVSRFHHYIIQSPWIHLCHGHSCAWSSRRTNRKEVRCG